jgi:hypothetical protein
MMAIIGAGTFGGYKIDQWMSNDFKGFTLGLMVISVVFAIVYGTRSLLKKDFNMSEKRKVGSQRNEVEKKSDDTNQEIEGRSKKIKS